MRISTVREFRQHTSTLSDNQEPLLVTRSTTLPKDLRRELFLVLSADIGRQLKRSKGAEELILKDFDSWKQKRRAAHCGR